MKLEAYQTIKLGHDAYHVASNPNGDIVAISRNNEISIIRSSTVSNVTFCTTHTIGSVSIHPSQECLSVVDKLTGCLLLIDFKGKTVAQLLPIPKKSTSQYTEYNGYECCSFDPTGKLIICGQHIDENTFLLRAIDFTTLKVVTQTQIKDPFGDSYSSIFPTGKPNLYSLWLAAGQDGQVVYWSNITTNSIDCSFEPSFKHCTPPAFSPAFDCLLIANEIGDLEKRNYPKTEDVVSMTIATDDEPEMPLSHSIQFIDNRFAICQTMDNRVYAIDTSEMNIAFEVELIGHEPQPPAYYYPGLYDEYGLCTDINYFQRAGHSIVFFTDIKESKSQTCAEIIRVPIDEIRKLTIAHKNGH